jgi:hypothetical protein
MTVRCFVAVDIGDAERKGVAELQRGLKYKADNVRWVRPDRMHLTLAFLGEVSGDFVEQARHDISTQGLEQSRIDHLFHHEERAADRVVDPVIGTASQTQPLARDIATRQRSLRAVIHANVPVHIETAHHLRLLFHPFSAQVRSPLVGRPIGGQFTDLLPQTAHFRYPVQSQQLPILSRSFAAQPFDGLDPTKSHRGQQNQDM